MTGHGQSIQQGNRVQVMAEVRAVNNRFLKTIVNGDIGAELQSLVEDIVRNIVKRGTVNVRIRIDRQQDPDQYRLNETAIAAYQSQLKRIVANAEIPLATILMLPGVVIEPTADSTDPSIAPLVTKAIHAAVLQLNEMRSREGTAMLDNLRVNLVLLQQLLQSVEKLAPRVVESYATRVKDRITQLMQKYDISTQPADVIREVGLFAERADIAEEVVRLRSHLQQFDDTMGEPESNGRKLDFLIQEMLRETNTIGSKASDAAIANCVVEMKTAIERMRELVQNIE